MKFKYLLTHSFISLTLVGCNNNNQPNSINVTSFSPSAIVTTNTNKKLPEVLPDETRVNKKPLKISTSEYENIKNKFSINNDEEKITDVADELGNLEPTYPLAQTETSCEYKPEDNLISFSYSPLSGLSCRSYIVEKDKNFELIKTKDDFIKMFAPINSKQEALSFALALIPNVRSMYDFDISNENTYNVEKINKTNVIENEKGYIVNLYINDCYGTREINQLVKKDGNIENLGITDIYYNTKQRQDIENHSLICE